jgi:hypothetical protein
MRTIELGTEILGATDRLDLAVVEAEMLWPDSEESREQWKVAAAMKRASERLAAGETLPQSVGHAAIKIAADPSYRTIEALQREAVSQLESGAIAGAILLDVIGLARTTDRVPLSMVVIPDISNRFAASKHATTAHPVRKLKIPYAGAERARAPDTATQGKAKSLETKTVYNKSWGPFRPVVHMWAAYCLDLDVFPCRPSKLVEFLNIADFFRRKGELALDLKGHPVLTPGECLGLPDCLRTMDFEFVSEG